MSDKNGEDFAILLILRKLAAFFGSWSELEVAVVVAVGPPVFVLVEQESTLRGKLALAYERYCARVPRWIAERRSHAI